MNKAILLGRITKNIELKQIQSQRGLTVTCAFNVAIDRRFKNQNGQRDTDFIPCVAWGKTAEFIAKYFEKGTRISLVGSIHPRTWENESGKHYTTEVLVEEVYFADSKRSQPVTGGNSSGAIGDYSDDDYDYSDPYLPDLGDDSLPFGL